MPRYEVRAFRETLVVDDDEEVVAAEIRPRPTEESAALVRTPDSDAEGIVCGYETENGPCQRETDGGRCWQHDD